MVVSGSNNDRDFDQYMKGLIRGLQDDLEFEIEIDEEEPQNNG